MKNDNSIRIKEWLPGTREIITLLDKKDKNNTLFKRLLACFAAEHGIEYRIQKPLTNIIHTNQSGYVEGRFIGETIRMIDDIMEFTKCGRISGIFSFFGLWNSFDSIEWNSLLQMFRGV